MSEIPISLSLLQREHLPMTLSWRNRSDVRRWFKHSDEISPPDHLAWFEAYLQKTDDRVYVAFAGGQPVGQLAIYNIDHLQRTAEVGRFVAAPEFRGRGYLRRSIAELIRLAREQLGMRSLYLDVLEDNLVAVTLYSKLGFRTTSQQGSVLRMNFVFEDEGISK